MQIDTHKLAIIIGTTIGIFWIIAALLPDYTVLWNS